MTFEKLTQLYECEAAERSERPIVASVNEHMAHVEFHGGIRKEEKPEPSTKAARKKIREKLLARLDYEHDWFLNHDWDEEHIELSRSIGRAEQILDNEGVNALNLEFGRGAENQQIATTEEIETLCNELRGEREARINVKEKTKHHSA